ncbi:MAG: LysR family transcriptional regulator [Candidatus Microbacterium phytovorans]|uniref:LysR family transcriptional regulator n=1 Tax=Candidatus Microbacterium phytovorans TaxID=3121374 RepID=A0AAJ6B4A0_9MICO|nr:LysR family transcriptional regulator [Microbacterium sp.]WEK14122.1 MAG: LysR family transcriptional regulator [Microbacterium sp.]
MPVADEPPLDALMTFLAVARRGRYTAAADALGLNHSTVSRRIATLERTVGVRLLVRSAAGWDVTEEGQRVVAIAERVEASLRDLSGGDQAVPSDASAGGEHAGGLRGAVRIAAPEAFTAHVLAPALTALRRTHPSLAVELVAVTQRARQHRSGVDLEIVAGRPEVFRAYATAIFDYSLRLYASRDYLDGNGAPSDVGGLARHPLVFYIESALQVDELDRALHALPDSPPSLRSTSVFAHLEATAAGAGIGLLPDFVADRDDRLVPVLPDTWEHRLSYWAVARDEGARNPVVAATLAAIQDQIANREGGR